MLPGPSAVTTALVASGLPAHKWRFEGFLPRRSGELERVLRSTETVVAFESPRRLPDSLKALAELAPDRPAAVCRELTKLHEEVVRGTLGELARRFRDDDVKGEIVLVIGPGGAAESPDIGFAVDALRGLVHAGARPRAAASVVAALTGSRPNELYRKLTGREPRRFDPRRASGTRPRRDRRRRGHGAGALVVGAGPGSVRVGTEQAGGRGGRRAPARALARAPAGRRLARARPGPLPRAGVDRATAVRR